jgi:hypothetical protein
MRSPQSDAIMKNINASNMLQYAAGISADDLSLYFTRADPRKGEIGVGFEIAGTAY